MRQRARGLAAGAVGFLMATAGACGGGGGAPDAGPDTITGGPVEPFPDHYCPGSPGCPGAGGATLRAGAARVNILPTIVESEWVDENENNHWERSEPFTDENGNGDFDATWIAGYGNGRPATGVNENDGLWVRALVLEQGDTRIAIAVIDCVGWFIDEIDRTKALLPATLELDHVLVTATHVHEAVDTVGLWGPVELATGLNPDYQALVRQATVDAIAAAAAALTPVTLSYAQTMTVDETGDAQPYVSDTRDPAIFDPRLTLLRFAATAEPDTTVATLIHWSAHPEYAGSRNNLLSADYVNWLREVIENGAPETLAGPAMPGLGGEVVFVNGAFGGQVGPGQARPIGPDGVEISSQGLAKAEAAGTNVGRLALAAISNADMVTDVVEPTLSFRTGAIYVIVENVFYHVAGIVGVFDRQLLGYDKTQPIDVGNMPYIRSRVTYLQIGSIGIVTAPGELHPELLVGGYDGSESWGYDIVDPANENPPNLALAPDGPYLRDLVAMNPGVELALLFGAAEDFLGYIVPAYNYELDPSSPYLEEAKGDHYEETNSVGPLVEEQVVGAMRAIITWQPPGE
jgi:hypothetical protein